MEKNTYTLYLREDIIKRLKYGLDHGYFTGSTSQSGVVDLALEKILDERKVPKFKEITEGQEA